MSDTTGTQYVVELLGRTMHERDVTIHDLRHENARLRAEITRLQAATESGDS